MPNHHWTLGLFFLRSLLRKRWSRALKKCLWDSKQSWPKCKEKYSNFPSLKTGGCHDNNNNNECSTKRSVKLSRLVFNFYILLTYFLKRRIKKSKAFCFDFFSKYFEIRLFLLRLFPYISFFIFIIHCNCFKLKEIYF